MQVERNGNKGRRGEDSITFRVTLTKVDIKRSLQRLLRLELKNKIYGLHSEEELREWLRKDAVGYLGEHKTAYDVVEWGFACALRHNYLCRSQHDQNSDIPLFYIPKMLLNLCCGPRLDRVAMLKTDYSIVPGVSADFEEQPTEIDDLTIEDYGRKESY